MYSQIHYVQDDLHKNTHKNPTFIAILQVLYHINPTDQRIQHFLGTNTNRRKSKSINHQKLHIVHLIE